MAGRTRGSGAKPRAVGPVYQQLLLFPERAEYLAQPQYHDYRIRLDHWSVLSAEFRRAFQAVYERKSGAVLLVHGEQGTGKTLFTRKLEQGFQEASAGGVTSSDPENLWHVISGGEPIEIEKVKEVTPRTAVRRVSAETGWLENETTFAGEDKHPMRIFIIDDVHKDVIVRELAASRSMLKVEVAVPPAPSEFSGLKREETADEEDCQEQAQEPSAVVAAARLRSYGRCTMCAA